MKATIVHESRGRMRLRLRQKTITFRQADLLETWLKAQTWTREAVVHERTGCIIVTYTGEREAVLSAIGAFTWAGAEETVTLPGHSTRALNREFQEKLAGKVLMKGAAALFLPAPLRAARVVWHMAPFLHKGLRCLGRRKIKVELLDALSIGISVGRRDFGTAGMVMFLLEIGELLEDWTRKKSVADLAESLSLHVDRVWLKSEAGEVLVPIGQVKPGDRVLVRAGGVIPLDGVVAEGEVTVNQASLTGESVPVAKRPGGAVYAGTVVEEGECVLEVRQATGQGRYDQIVEMIQRSEQLKSAAEAKASSLADKLVPYTFGGSLLSLVLTRNVTRALSVLMVDFSCALKLAMPLAVLSAMREAGREHITVKGGKFLEAVARADTIVFDKTGTLTAACPQVEGVIDFTGRGEDELLRCAACMEEHFPHSMARAVTRAAEEKGLNHEERHAEVEYVVAHGVATTLEGERALIGSRHFIFEDEGVICTPEQEARIEAEANGRSVLYLAIGGKLAGALFLSDPPRPEAAQAIAALRALGIRRVVMLTGDQETAARAVCEKLGIDEFRAQVLPADKAALVEGYKAGGHRLIMVGDGVNDSPALAAADVSVAMKDASDLAREVADITLLSSDLRELAALRRLSQRMLRRIGRNYRAILSINTSLLALGICGVLPPTTTALLHNASTMAISAASMRPCLTGPERRGHEAP